MNKKVTIFDVEVAPNKSMVGFLDYETKEVTQFQHKESDSINEYIKGRTLVGFNSKNYDNSILTAMMRGKEAKEIYNISVDIIEHGAHYWDYPNFIESDIDLIEVAPGAASLKLYGARLNTKKLQDLPYDPHEKHNKKMWKEVCKYNINDLYLTQELYEFLMPQLNIRKDIGAKYKINVMSRSDAQIAEDVFKKVLGITKKPKIDIPKYVEYTAPKYIKFKSKHLNELKKKFENSVYEINRKTGKFLPQEWLKEKIVIGGIDYTIGYGGLHSNEKSMMITGGLKNTDIASMYPSLIINSGKFPHALGKEWLILYTGFRDDRMKIKARMKEIKGDNAFEKEYSRLDTEQGIIKIEINGSYGKLNSHYSILYAPHLLLDTTITGQLSLLMVIEKLIDKGVKVVSANTDGLEYLDDGTDKAEKIIDKLGRKMNLVWEHASYDSLYARDVNSYIAVYPDHVKRKGFYSEPKIDKNNQHPIVQKAIADFLSAGTSMEDTIRSCKSIADFCVSRQVTGGALWSPEVYPNTEEYEAYIVREPFKQNKALEKRNEVYQRDFVLMDADKWYLGKVVRFYYSTDGHKMYYKKSGNTVPLSLGSKPMMDLIDTIPKDLDYDKYIELANNYLKDLGWVK